VTRRAVPDRWLRGGASLLVALLACALIGCGKKEAPPRSAAGPVGVGVMVGGAGGAPGARPAPPAFDSAAPITDSTSSVHYASLEALRDTVERLLRGLVSAADTAVHVSRDTVTFPYWFAKAPPARGWVVKAVINDASGCPVEMLESALMARGWVMKYGYESDGADGTALGLASRDYFCLIEGRWVGGDESDTTFVPPPGCTVLATCVPRRADDVMK
jgi:hypothetical protein